MLAAELSAIYFPSRRFCRSSWQEYRAVVKLRARQDEPES